MSRLLVVCKYFIYDTGVYLFNGSEGKEIVQAVAEGLEAAAGVVVADAGVEGDASLAMVALAGEKPAPTIGLAPRSTISTLMGSL